MGFFEKLGEQVGKEIVKQKENYDSAVKSSERKKDKRLIEDFKSEQNYVKKMAMYNELKKRGYGEQD